LTPNHWLSEEEIHQEYELIRKAQQEPELFAPLYDRYFERIFQFIYRRTEDEVLTADLTSQTFLKALQNIKRYAFTGVPFSAWLYRIASNEINKHHRFHRRSRFLYSLEESRLIELLKEYDEDNFDNQNQIENLVNALKELPDDVLLVLELRFFEEKGFKEIAFIMNISESGVKMKTYRALNRLKEILQKKNSK